MVAAQLHNIARNMRRSNITHILSELESFPVIKTGYRISEDHRLDVVRCYTGKKGCRERHQHDFTSEKGKELLAMKKQKDHLLSRLDNLAFRRELEKELKSEPALNERYNIPSRFSKGIFDQLVELNDTNINKAYPFDGRFFRSKSEVIIAQYLKELGLEYKYEVVIKLGGKEYHIDFAVYSHETGRFFFIEHFGMMGDEAYRARAFQKMATYFNYGLQEGVDIMFSFENANDGFNINMLKGKILGILSAQMLFLM